MEVLNDKGEKATEVNICNLSATEVLKLSESEKQQFTKLHDELGIHGQRKSTKESEVQAILLPQDNAPESKTAYCKPHSLAAKVMEQTQDKTIRVFADLPPKIVPTAINFIYSQTHDRKRGSGSVLAPEGLVLTDEHVITDATHIQVRTEKGTFDAHVVGVDHKTDLALLALDGVPKGTELDCSKLAKENQKLQKGEPIFARGFRASNDDQKEPFLYPGYCVQMAKPSPALIPEGCYADRQMLESRTMNDHGDSGGPVYKIHGKVSEMIGVYDFTAYANGKIVATYDTPVDDVWKLVKKTPGITINKDGTLSFHPVDYSSKSTALEQ